MGKVDAHSALPSSEGSGPTRPPRRLELSVLRAIAHAGGSIADVPVKETPNGGVLSSEALSSLGPQRVARLLELDLSAAKAKYAGAFDDYAGLDRLK